MLIPIWALTILLAYFAIQRGQYPLLDRAWTDFRRGDADQILLGRRFQASSYRCSLQGEDAQDSRALSVPRPLPDRDGWHLWYVDSHHMGTVTLSGITLLPFSSRIKAVRFLVAQLLYLYPFYSSSLRHGFISGEEFIRNI